MGIHYVNEVEIELFIGMLSFGLGFVLNKRTRLLIQVMLLIFKMAKWYHDTHPQGQQASKNYTYDDQLTRLYEKNLMSYDDTTVGNLPNAKG